MRTLGEGMSMLKDGGSFRSMRSETEVPLKMAWSSLGTQGSEQNMSPLRHVPLRQEEEDQAWQSYPSCQSWML